MVAVLAAALVAFVVPLAVAVRGQLVGRSLDELQVLTEQAAIIIDDQAADCGQVDVFLTVNSQALAPSFSLFSRVTGDLLGAPQGHQPVVGPELRRALGDRATAGRRHSLGSLAVAVPLSTDACGQPLVLHAQVPDTAVVGSIRRAWLGLAAVGLAVLALAAIAGHLVAGRLARPLQDLAGSAAALGDGDFSVRAPRSGMPEVDAIAQTLDRTGARLGRAVDRGRTFAADASHQLRTPMTALRLHLEGMQAQGVAPDQVAAALTEADRLEATVAELVALTSLDTAEEVVAPADLVAPVVAAAEAAAHADGREVALEVVPTPAVRVRPAAVRQALQVLLDNALQHGQGTITVWVAPTLPDQPGPDPGAHRGVRLCVADEGPGPAPETLASLRARDRGAALPPSGGRGLVLARVLVEGEGGRLLGEDVEGRTRLCLVLPVAESPSGPLGDAAEGLDGR